MAPTAESQVLTQALQQADNDSESILVDKINSRYAHAELKASLFLSQLKYSNWLAAPTELPSPNVPVCSAITTNEPIIPDATPSQLSKWLASVKVQENIIAQAHMSRADPNNQGLQPDDQPAPSTELGVTSCTLDNGDGFCFPTELNVPDTSKISMSTNEIIERIANENGLNEKQLYTFKIVAKGFISRHITTTNKDALPQPLHLFMTGPGGTGKTYVIKALQQLMAMYKCDDMLRYLAPTGSAAALIVGLTIHKGLGIQIWPKSGSKHNERELGEDENWTVDQG